MLILCPPPWAGSETVMLVGNDDWRASERAAGDPRLRLHAPQSSFISSSSRFSPLLFFPSLTQEAAAAAAGRQGTTLLPLAPDDRPTDLAQGAVLVLLTLVLLQQRSQLPRRHRGRTTPRRRLPRRTESRRCATKGRRRRTSRRAHARRPNNPFIEIEGRFKGVLFRVKQSSGDVNCRIECRFVLLQAR